LRSCVALLQRCSANATAACGASESMTATYSGRRHAPAARAGAGRDVVRATVKACSVRKVEGRASCSE
jgi:hypothetical protein